MKQNQKIITGIAALLAVIGIVAMAVLIGNRPNTESNNPTPEVICPIAEVEGATTVVYDGVAGETALVTLQGLCEVQTQSSSYGDFVTAIGGKDAGTEYYWAFYVNDDYANEGAGTFKAQEGDKIKWVLTRLDAAF